MSLGLTNPSEAELSAPAGQGTYTIGLSDHLKAIQDEEVLMVSVLLHTYALAESATADHLGVSSRSFGGIEGWGGQLLAAAGHKWDGVDGELPGRSSWQ